jgi:hypothetical protein
MLRFFLFSSFLTVIGCIGCSASASAIERDAGPGDAGQDFDLCDTPLDGDEAPNGFVYLKQIDVGKPEASEESDEENLDEGGEDSESESEFESDRPYNPSAGYGYTGSAGEVTSDPAWTIQAWPYGGRGDPRIHLNNRVGFDGYRFDLANGVYAITWHFIEKQEHWSGFRKADLLIEGRIAVSDFDIFEEVGNRFMVKMRAIAKVEDGHLDLDFISKGPKEPVLLSAIEVEATDPDLIAPQDVADLKVRGGYEQAVLTWTPGVEKDLRGVIVWRASSADGTWIRVNKRIVTLRHFVDSSAEPGESYYYKVVSQDLFCNESGGTIAGPVEIRDHESSRLPVFEIEIGEEALEVLTGDVSLDLYVPATLFIDGQEHQIEIRNRGASTRSLSKPNFKIRLLGDKTHQGRNGFKLNSEVVDQMMITEKLSYDLFGMTEATAPAAQYVHVVLAGRYMGVYTEIEEVDSLFFKNRGIFDGGNLYRLGTGLLNILEEEGAYEEIYEQKTNEQDPAGCADLIDFIEEVNHTPEHLLSDWFEMRFSRDRYIDFLAVNMIVANFDMIDGNQYIYHDTSEDIWYHVPWDYNNGAFSEPWLSPLALTFYESGMGNPWWFNSLTRFFANAELKKRFLTRLDELINGELSTDAVVEIASAVVDSAETDVLLDPWMVAWERDEYYSSETAPAIAEFIEARYGFLREAEQELQIIGGPLLINEYQAINTGEVVDEFGEPEPWIELYNRGEETASLLNVCLTPDLRIRDKAHCFNEPIQIDPGQARVLFADGEPDDGELHLGFVLNTDGGEIGLFQAAEGEGEEETGGRVFDAAFYGPQTPGESYGRLENGSDEWGPIETPTPGE